MRIVPELGRSRPVRHLMVVDLPAPFGPRNPKKLPAIAGKRFRIYYATQTGNRPFRIRLFCNREEKLTEQYRRYLEAGMVEEFDLNGCPIYFDLVGKEKDETRGSRGGGNASAALGVVSPDGDGKENKKKARGKAK